MRALAWDDEPEPYLTSLRRFLEKYHIDLHITTQENEFEAEFADGEWDFIVTDLWRANYPSHGEDDKLGVHLAREVANNPKGKEMPIFMVTQKYNPLSQSMVEELPRNVILRSKSTSPGWMADSIYEELVRRGVYVNRKNVFLIHGHDRATDAATSTVQGFLIRNGANAIRMSGSALWSELAEGTLKTMNNCAAFVAICTPDDNLEKGTFQPRQNVLLEIGMAMGLSRGLKRLTILQRYGNNPDEKAELPSDLGGLVPLRFAKEVRTALPDLYDRLLKLHVELNPDPVY